MIGSFAWNPLVPYSLNMQWAVNGTASVEYDYQKSSDFVNYFMDKAAEAKAVADSFQLLSALSSAKEFLANMAAFLTSDGGSKILTWLGIISGLIAAGAFIFGSAGFSAAVFGSLAIVGGFAALMSDHYLAIANDPPDPNYSEVYKYSGQTVNIDFGAGDDFNQYMATLIETQITSYEALQGTLTSLERVQGALNAGDFKAANTQADALQQFYSDVLMTRTQLGGLVKGLPDVMRAASINDIDVRSVDINDTRQVISEGFDERVLSTLFGLGFDPNLQSVAQANALAVLDNEPLHTTSLFALLENYGSILDPTAVSIPGTAPLALLGFMALLATSRRPRQSARRSGALSVVKWVGIGSMPPRDLSDCEILNLARNVTDIEIGMLKRESSRVTA